MAAVSPAHALVLVLGHGAADENRVVGMSLYMLLEILRPLERLSAEFALMRLERNMDADVRGDVVTLDSGSAATRPLTRQVEVVGALSAHMSLADVILREC
jgi:hypothetical protein